MFHYQSKNGSGLQQGPGRFHCFTTLIPTRHFGSVEMCVGGRNRGPFGGLEEIRGGPCKNRGYVEIVD